MLSEEKNLLFTEIDVGKPIRNLLRQYWNPVAGISELDDKLIK